MSCAKHVLEMSFANDVLGAIRRQRDYFSVKMHKSRFLAGSPDFQTHLAIQIHLCIITSNFHDECDFPQDSWPRHGPDACAIQTVW